MSEDKDAKTPSPERAKYWAVLCCIIAGLSLVASIVAWSKADAMQDQIDEVKKPLDKSTGTWICESPSGQLTAVRNPAN